MLEILAPAGNAESAKAALRSGADAIYLGYTAFSARQGADNFDLSALQLLVKEARAYGVNVYVAMNTLIKDAEIESFIRAVVDVWKTGVQAIILQDIFLGKRIKQLYPDIILHASTQAGVCNENGAKFVKENGFSRVILARETPFDEIKKIAQIIETEVFVQGALCTCFSGQCYFSSFVGGNSGNRGRCKQPCRKRYYFDRNGNTEYSYALSLSDLCLGDDIRKLKEAGVVSFKIEGRMRRAEYVAAAVQYYRALLDGKDGTVALSNLKRTYNRGNYTKGLAFGQDKRLLSTAVQGHIGEKIGVVKVLNGQYVVETSYKPSAKDAFKILRDGQEIGGAYFAKAEKKSFSLRCKQRLKNGDGVFITTDTQTNERLLSVSRKKCVRKISLYFVEGEQPIAESGNVRLIADKPLQTAQNRPLDEAEVRACFSKTDTLPIQIEFDVVLVKGNIFIAKGELNAFRRAFYAEIEKDMLEDRTGIEYKHVELPISVEKNNKTAVISNCFERIQTDIAIYKPDRYDEALPSSFIDGKFDKFIYYPAFCTSKDEMAILSYVQAHKLGVYVENYGGVYFALEHGAPICIGTGLNVTNSIALEGWNSIAKYVVLSKELNEKEIAPLVGEKSFVLSTGDIKLMDLCYCPFGKTCAKCDKQNLYMLTDENGRKFPVRRYVATDGACRFEVYNCANLVSTGYKGIGKCIDVTVSQNKAYVVDAKDDEVKQKQMYTQYTSGHLKRGVL